MMGGPWVDGRGRPSLHRSRLLALHKAREHALWIDRYKQSLAARQHFPFLVQDLGHIGVLPALHLNFARFHAQGPVQRHRLQIIHRNLGSQSHYLTQFVHLAHGFIEDGRDDAAVAVSGRSGVTLAQAESAHETAALLVVGETQAHAVGIILAAGEAIVLLEFYVACVVSSLGSSSFGLLATHRKILSRAPIGTVLRRNAGEGARSSRPSRSTPALDA